MEVALAMAPLMLQIFPTEKLSKGKMLADT